MVFGDERAKLADYLKNHDLKFEMLQLGISCSHFSVFHPGVSGLRMKITSKDNQVLVIGNHSSGKSTFINKLLGKEVRKMKGRRATATAT